MFVHGVGSQAAGYSTHAQKWFASKVPNFYGSEALWSPVLDRYENKMMKEVARKGSSTRPAQKLVVQTLADALCFQNRKEEIFDVLDQAYVRLRADEVHIFAHSLGVLLVLEWMRSREKVRVAKLFSFGCNLELFNLGAETKFVTPPQVDMPGKWVNAFDPSDMLGWPLRSWLPAVHDIEVNVGSILTSWNGLAHTGYFHEKSLWLRTFPNEI